MFIGCIVYGVLLWSVLPFWQVVCRLFSLPGITSLEIAMHLRHAVHCNSYRKALPIQWRALSRIYRINAITIALSTLLLSTMVILYTYEGRRLFGGGGAKGGPWIFLHGIIESIEATRVQEWNRGFVQLLTKYGVLSGLTIGETGGGHFGVKDVNASKIVLKDPKDLLKRL